MNSLASCDHKISPTGLSFKMSLKKHAPRDVGPTLEQRQPHTSSEPRGLFFLTFIMKHNLPFTSTHKPFLRYIYEAAAENTFSASTAIRDALVRITHIHHATHGIPFHHSTRDQFLRHMSQSYLSLTCMGRCTGASIRRSHHLPEGPQASTRFAHTTIETHTFFSTHGR